MIKNSIILLVILSTVACVSQKKYDSLLAEKVKLEGDKLSMEDSLQQKKATINDLNQEIEEQQESIATLKSKIQAEEERYDSLLLQYETLNEYYENLANSSSKVNKDLAEKQKQLLEMQTDLEAQKAKNERLAIDLAEREARVAELEQILADKEAAVNELKKKVSDALLAFNENDLSIEVKNGKVYVSLAEQLLFGSGSVTVDPKGQKALKKLAQVLAENQDVNILVEGHTDDVPVGGNNRYLKDNWDLSVLRATSIVRILTANGAAPERVTAAGKGEFAPKASNESAEGRQTNRRTEIILTPKLDKLFQILEAN